jgi:diguanylate cyclase (GGDEF)-like protein
MFDLDYFKRINDTHGHAVGDEVLAEVARLCLEEVRAVDTVARLGGEEFVVLMPQASLENARLAAERLRRRLKRTWKVAGAAVATSASFGVAELGGGGFEAMMRCADSRLYRAKREGRDRVCADGEFRDLEEGRTVQA